jgi:hypothetical protein
LAPLVQSLADVVKHFPDVALVVVVVSALLVVVLFFEALLFLAVIFALSVVIGDFPGLISALA